jgi:hypothetical protein
MSLLSPLQDSKKLTPLQPPNGIKAVSIWYQSGINSVTGGLFILN